MSIRLHEKYGLNPTMSQCFFCGKEKDILLFGADTKGFKTSPDGEMPRNVGVIDMEPCSKCAELMEKGVMLIRVSDDSQDSENPYRTGKICVVKDSFIEKVVQPEDLVQRILKRRFSFVPDTIWEVLKLPEG